MPVLRPHAMAAMGAPALGKGPARGRGLSLRVLRGTDSRISQDPDAGGWRMDRHGHPRGSAQHRLSPVVSLFAHRLAVVGGNGAPMGGGAGFRRAAARLQEHEAGRDVGGLGRGPRLGAPAGSQAGLSGAGADARSFPDGWRGRSAGSHRGRRLGMGPRTRVLAGRSCRHRPTAPRPARLEGADGRSDPHL